MASALSGLASWAGYLTSVYKGVGEFSFEQYLAVL